MNKTFKKYLFAWCIVLVIFNVVAFVPKLAKEIEFTASFWIGYLAITACFILQLLLSKFTLKEKNLTKTFYNISIFTVSLTGLMLNIIVGGISMSYPNIIPYWLSIVLSVVVLGLTAILLIKATVATEIISGIDDKIKGETFFIKSLTTQANTLMSLASTDEAKAECKKVYEAIRYSDPMSNSQLSTIEGQINSKFAEFYNAINVNNIEAAKAAADILVILINDRNGKCKLLK